MTIYHPYTIFPLGDSALTIEFGNIIDVEVNKRVLSFFYLLKKQSLPFVLDLVPAYCSLTVYYDLVQLSQDLPEDETAFERMVMIIEGLTRKGEQIIESEGRDIDIPVCYEEPYAPDIRMLAKEKNIPVEEVIRLHTTPSYQVYMIGFLPGFAYMGLVDEKIAFPRKAVPRINVAPGSVGIAARQTGIYPLESPGGWQIIGRTPISLFNNQKEDPVYLRAGDRVRFHSISEDEFAHYQAGRP